MLGDNELYGRFYSNLDDKNRLCLPAKSGVEAGEILYVLLINGSKYLVDKNMFHGYLDYTLKRIAESTSTEEFKTLTEFYDSLCSMVIKEVKVDKQHRVLMTDIYKIEDGKAEIMGVGKGIKLINK